MGRIRVNTVLSAIVILFATSGCDDGVSTPVSSTPVTHTTSAVDFSISEHPTATAAFAEIDRLSSEMLRTGAPSNAVELIVVEGARIVPRPGTE
jgi:hypothetical protein